MAAAGSAPERSAASLHYHAMAAIQAGGNGFRLATLAVLLMASWRRTTPGAAPLLAPHHMLWVTPRTPPPGVSLLALNVGSAEAHLSSVELGAVVFAADRCECSHHRRRSPA